MNIVGKEFHSVLSRG